MTFNRDKYRIFCDCRECGGIFYGVERNRNWKKKLANETLVVEQKGTGHKVSVLGQKVFFYVYNRKLVLTYCECISNT